MPPNIYVRDAPTSREKGGAFGRSLRPRRQARSCNVGFKYGKFDEPVSRPIQLDSSTTQNLRELHISHISQFFTIPDPGSLRIMNLCLYAQGLPH